MVHGLGGKKPAELGVPEDKLVSIPVRTINKENVEAFQKELADNLAAAVDRLLAAS